MKSGGKFIPGPAAISLEEQNWTSSEENRLLRETHFRLAFYWGVYADTELFLDNLVTTS